jgi:rod shape-determining protein MreC
MRERLAAHWAVPRWLAGAALLLAIVLLLVPGAGRVAEGWASRGVVGLQAAVAAVAEQVRGGVDTMQRAAELRAENRALREQVERLQAEITQLHELELENYELRQLAGLQPLPLRNELIPARVVGRDPLPFVQVIALDVGSEQGVREDMPVVTWRGLIGRVIDVQPTTARVLLITDASSAVAVRVQAPESRATGVVRGRNDALLLLQYVEQQAPLETGDLLITSGLGGVFPPGVPVGKVVQVRKRDQDLFQEALVEPTARLGQLERVYVLTRGALEGQ